MGLTKDPTLVVRFQGRTTHFLQVRENPDVALPNPLDVDLGFVGMDEGTSDDLRPESFEGRFVVSRHEIFEPMDLRSDDVMTEAFPE